MKNKATAIVTLAMTTISLFSLGIVFLLTLTKAIVEAKKNEEKFFSAIKEQNEELQTLIEDLHDAKKWLKDVEKHKKDKERRRKKQEEVFEFELNGKE